MQPDAVNSQLGGRDGRPIQDEDLAAGPAVLQLVQHPGRRLDPGRPEAVLAGIGGSEVQPAADIQQPVAGQVDQHQVPGAPAGQGESIGPKRAGHAVIELRQWLRRSVMADSVTGQLGPPRSGRPNAPGHRSSPVSLRTAYVMATRPPCAGTASRGSSGGSASAMAPPATSPPLHPYRRRNDHRDAGQPHPPTTERSHRRAQIDLARGAEPRSAVPFLDAWLAPFRTR